MLAGSAHSVDDVAKLTQWTSVNGSCFRPIVSQKEGVIGDNAGAWDSSLNPNMLSNAILQAMRPLPCVLFPLTPVHAPLPLLLISLPAPCVYVAAAVMHGPLPMLQVILPATCVHNAILRSSTSMLEILQAQTCWTGTCQHQYADASMPT